MLGIALALGCAAAPAPAPDPHTQLEAAHQDLARAGFGFDADVNFARDPYVVCEAISCAELQVRNGRRTVLLAREAWDSPERLRASLLDIWGRYQKPRAPDYRDKAESALRVLSDGPRVGIADPVFLRRVYHMYRQLWSQVPPSQLGALPRPDDLAYP